jgi:predicted Zn-dependent protease
MSNFNLGLQEAQDLLFKKKRGAALERLRGLRSFRLNSNQIRETQRLADSISTQFLTERGQQMFELAKTFMAKDPSEALSRLNEAKNEEPDNFVVLTWIGRTLLMKGDCEGAVDATEQPLRLFPTSQDIRLIRLQGLACLDKRKVLKTELQSEAADPSSSFGLYLELVKAQLAWFEGEYKTSLTHAEKARALPRGSPLRSIYQPHPFLRLLERSDQLVRRSVRCCREP